MPIVRNTVHLADGTLAAGKITVRLVAGSPGVGFDTANDITTGRAREIPFAGGAWQVDLDRNDDLSPTGTYWLITEEVTGGSRVDYAITVPAVGDGPFWVYDRLTTIGDAQASLTYPVAAAGNNALAIKVNGDSVDRFIVRGDGRIEWGDGSVPRDVNLYRSGADTLRTDDSLSVAGNVTTGGTLAVTGNATAGGTLSVTGQVTAGDLQVTGQAGFNKAPDTNIPVTVTAPNDQPGVQVSSTDASNTRALIEARGPDTSTAGYGTRVTGDSNDRFGIDTDGYMSWGTGSGSRDVTLYRSGADELRTDDDFRARSLTADSSIRAGFLGTTSTTDHAATVYQRATSGTGAALNVVSDNPAESAMFLSGTETGRGTLKVTHRGQAGGTDGSASALSIDLTVAGTAARGIFITGTDGPTTGDLIVARNNSRDDFVVKSTGRVGVALPTAATPDARVDVRQADDTTPGVSVRANSTSASNMLELRRSSDGAVRTRVDAQCQFVTQQSAFLAGPVTQVGGTSGTAGGGSGVLGVTNATTVPTTNPSGGGVLYAESGQLKWRDPNGDVTTLTGSPVFPGNLTVSGVGQVLDAYKTADESVTNSTAMQDDDHLVINVVSGAVYIVEAHLLYTAATAGDIKVALIAGSGTPTFQHSCMAMETGTASVVSSIDMGSGPYGTEHARGSASTTTPQVILMKGTLEATATTTFRLRWAQNSSNGTATTILRGSYLTARRIA